MKWKIINSKTFQVLNSTDRAMWQLDETWQINPHGQNKCLYLGWYSMLVPQFETHIDNLNFYTRKTYQFASYSIITDDLTINIIFETHIDNLNFYTRKTYQFASYSIITDDLTINIKKSYI